MSLYKITPYIFGSFLNYYSLLLNYYGENLHFYEVKLNFYRAKFNISAEVSCGAA